MRKILVSLTLLLFLISCGGKKVENAAKPPTENEEAIKIYEEGLESLRKGNYLYAPQQIRITH